MSAQIIDGKAIARAIRERTKEASSKLRRAPALAVVMVGENPASAVYVRNKVKACNEVGITSIEHRLPADSSDERLLEVIRALNEDPCVDGILVQLPLPEHMHAGLILETIDPSKDVDGFHIYNTGKLVTTGGGFKPCTPAGIIELLKAINYPIEGKHAVIIGRSNIVSKPLASMLLSKNATVTICHSKTQNLKEIASTADILVVATGKANMVTSDYVKQGAVVIDVGISRDKDGKIHGDVDFDNVAEKTSYITPVPGGVGAMTIAMLMQNTLRLYKIQRGQK